MRQTSSWMYAKVTNIGRSFRTTRRLSFPDLCQLPDSLLDGDTDIFCDLAPLEAATQDVINKIADKVVKLWYCNIFHERSSVMKMVASALNKMERVQELKIYGKFLWFHDRLAFPCKLLPFHSVMMQNLSSLKCLTLEGVTMITLKSFQFNSLTHVTLRSVKGDVSQLLLNCQETLQCLRYGVFCQSDMTFIQHLEMLNRLNAVHIDDLSDIHIMQGLLNNLGYQVNSLKLVDCKLPPAVPRMKASIKKLEIVNVLNCHQLLTKICTSLEYLSISYCGNYLFSNESCTFPKLKVLHVYGEDAVEMRIFLSKTPNLQVLHLNYTNGELDMKSKGSCLGIESIKLVIGDEVPVGWKAFLETSFSTLRRLEAVVPDTAEAKTTLHQMLSKCHENLEFLKVRIDYCSSKSFHVMTELVSTMKLVFCNLNRIV